MILTGRSAPATPHQPGPLLPRPRPGSLRWEHLYATGEAASSVVANPHLGFADGRAREAMERYASVLGGDLSVTSYTDLGSDGPLGDLVGHALLVTPGGIVLTGADVQPGTQVQVGDSVAVSLSGSAEDAEQLRGWFDALAEGGQVRQPLAAAAWGHEVGMLVDRFGIAWVVTIAGPGA
ncbi:PhnB protein [Nocardioides cavernae]|uniref:PhnB protein n=1 Tax=Nocardioides cavernae TaxID=1921566 RepID=A0A7Y9KRC2_9ACTN|nr:VOC family protein [Nocardioides cavernae]NYE36430.1 PhnB protein [Nocardioides cavernae]